jgi:DNA-binding response OmpR family regulator
VRKAVTIRALIVEDEENLVVLLRLHLEREGFEVHEALDGRAALEVARRVDPDVVVLDYLTNPFSPAELVARIRAMLRRPRGGARQPEAEQHAPLRFGVLTVDPARREARLNGEEIVLTAMEFGLLATLASEPGIVFDRARLLEKLWGGDYFGSDHVIDVHVANLRKKIGDDPQDPRYIQTVRGIGYRFRPA